MNNENYMNYKNNENNIDERRFTLKKEYMENSPFNSKINYSCCILSKQEGNFVIFLAIDR